MPIYEYRCQDCGRKSSVFVRTASAAAEPACSHCGGRHTERVMSAFAYHRSEQTRLEQTEEPALYNSPEYYKDPRNIGRWAEKRMDEMGMEMPDQVKDMIGKAREGEVDEILDKRGLD
jgi:putative FmdB family regulatory protein